MAAAELVLAALQVGAVLDEVDFLGATEAAVVKEVHVVESQKHLTMPGDDWILAGQEVDYLSHRMGQKTSCTPRETSNLKTPSLFVTKESL